MYLHDFNLLNSKQEKVPYDTLLFNNKMYKKYKSFYSKYLAIGMFTKFQSMHED